jgi:prepilin-type N-terminal cleavage/methylation domain-containing protein
VTASTRFRNGRRPRAAAGFSLIELAVGIAVIALLLGSLLVPLQSQVESRKVADTQKILDNAREALLGYAAANGYFPCPADYAGGSAGAEATGSTHTASSGACPSNVTGGVTPTAYIGYLPAVTLGFTPVDANGYAVDAWGGTGTQNRIRYAVSATTVNSVNRPFTNSGGMRSALMSNILGATLLSVCNTATGASSTACASAATTLTSNAIAVIWSLGANAATPIGGTVSTQEAENVETLANANRVFVLRDKSNVAGTEFDDLVVWISTPILFSRLIAAGQLP